MSSARNSDRDAARQWIDTARAAAILGVSERAVQKWCSVGKLAARRVQGVKMSVEREVRKDRKSGL